ncbi:transglutaminase-like domain-containing protein [Sulfurospirillum barnesii]|uniref:Transglutaminase-like enzyme, predicted cysteine protease n=1 Tax=Sulfurospirillum barnesii (strain ATCC 700032 / DSM 10660 / SES-3) TaxID=760154 RepID=I3XW28_SULBS|nr:transglutaminase family protein [Sulfurospirillum barnesii]AFL68152.1 transglutaminase-like enzyme, predicted cysteine protease [Sulfurospirillum barnesii SES-3]
MSQRVNFSYAFSLHFKEAIRKHAFCLRMLPLNNAMQTLLQWKLLINENEVPFYRTKDGFGNDVLFGTIEKSHRQFEAKLSGSVAFHGSYQYTDNDNASLYLHPTTLTPFSSFSREYLDALMLPLSALSLAKMLNQTIFQNFEYEAGISTTSCDANALLLRHKGVCQDFSHLLITLLRLKGIPARYVAGFIDGEGESHAWVEAFIDGYWRGFDPTHGIMLEHQSYIKIAHGRDFMDCRLNRGVFIGKSQQSLHVNVSVGRDEQ